MTHLRKLRFSPGLVLGAIALAVALSGTGYAAVNALPRNSVTSVQVKDRSLLAKNFKAGQLPRGPAGPPEPQARPAPPDRPDRQAAALP
jgi:hypothetical protein